MARLFSLKTKIFSLLFKAASSRFLKPVFVFLFNHTGHFMPDKNLIECAYWRVFYHPKPTYPWHILILPKSGIRSLTDAPNESEAFYSELFMIVKDLIEEFNLKACGCRLITNGGTNQGVPQWHWHLISESFGEISD
jgi:diadenosine tetraphosphate (Ap4A) HIT family hydrolase